jgi:hypothetical protein
MHEGIGFPWWKNPSPPTLKMTPFTTNLLSCSRLHKRIESLILNYTTKMGKKTNQPP